MHASAKGMRLTGGSQHSHWSVAGGGGDGARKTQVRIGAAQLGVHTLATTMGGTAGKGCGPPLELRGRGGDGLQRLGRRHGWARQH